MIEIYYARLKSLMPFVLCAWLFVWLVCCGLLANRLLGNHVLIDNSVAIWFDTKDPEIAIYEEYNQIFGEKEWTVLVLKAESIFNSNFVEAVKEISAELESMDHVVKVTSIANVRDNFITADGDLEYNILYDNAGADFSALLYKNPIFINNLIQENSDKYTSILIQNDNFIYDQSLYRLELIDQINQLMADYADLVEDYGLAGTTVVNAELNRAALKDVIVFYTLVTVFLTLICWLILKSSKDLAVVFAVVLSSALPAMGVFALLEIPFNMATVMLPTILIALSVAGVLHFITEFHLERPYVDSEQAMKITLQKLFKPTCGTAATTLVGFSSFSLSHVSPIFQLGMCAAFGIFMAWLAIVALVPLLLPWLWRDSVKHHEGAFTLKNTDLIFARPKWVFWGVVLLCACTIGLKDAHVDTDYSKFFASSTKVSQAYDMIDDAGFSQNPLIITLDFSSADRFFQSWSSILQFEQALEQLDDVNKVLSVTDFIREIDKAFNTKETSSENNGIDHYNSQQLSQLLFLGELSGNDDIEDFISPDKKHIQIIAFADYMSSVQLSRFKQKVSVLKQSHLHENIDLNITGTATLWANMDANVSHTQVVSLLWVALGMILLMPVFIGSSRLSAIALVINFLPLAVTISVMSILGISINIATAILGAISIGIVVDDTIHLMARINMNESQGMSPMDAIGNALRTTGTSIIRTTIIVAVAFFCMASSDFLPTAHFGIFVTFSVLLALFLDLFAVPNLLVYLYARKQAKFVTVN